MPCVLHPILGLLAPIICLVATMSLLHMPCPIACHLLHLIASHMMNNCSFHCVECHTIFTTPNAHYAWIILHLTHVFRHFILFGVVNVSYAYHRPFVECFMHDCYDLGVDAYSIVTHICIATSHLHACFHDVLDFAQFTYLHAMPHSLVTPYAMLDDNTFWVNHLLNAWFCTNANHICFSKCFLYMLLVKESLDGATSESAHFELHHDKCLVVVHFYMVTPSLSHGDEDHDPWTDISQGGEMMRSIPRPSPWTSHHYRKHGVDLRRELAHAPSKLR